MRPRWVKILLIGLGTENPAKDGKKKVKPYIQQIYTVRRKKFTL